MEFFVSPLQQDDKQTVLPVGKLAVCRASFCKCDGGILADPSLDDPDFAHDLLCLSSTSSNTEPKQPFEMNTKELATIVFAVSALSRDFEG